MRAVDAIRIRELLGTIASSEEHLRELAAQGEDIFLGDFRNTESAKYLLIVATEAAIDVCNHIVSRLGGRAPRDYADCFTVLADLKVITTELAGRLKRMARFGIWWYICTGKWITLRSIVSLARIWMICGRSDSKWRDGCQPYKMLI